MGEQCAPRQLHRFANVSGHAEFASSAGLGVTSALRTTSSSASGLEAFSGTKWNRQPLKNRSTRHGLSIPRVCSSSEDSRSHFSKFNTEDTKTATPVQNTVHCARKNVLFLWRVELYLLKVDQARYAHV